MAKAKTVYICQECGEEHLKWQGQCSACGEWNTLVEEVREVKTKGGMRTGREITAADLTNKTINYAAVESAAEGQVRTSTGIGEFDRVLGGEADNQGMVAGAVMLIGGEPGIGKSTILTQVVIKQLEQLEQKEQKERAGKRSGKNKSLGKILYVAGEESPSQISLRINRIYDKEHKTKNSKDDSKQQLPAAVGEKLIFATSTDVDEVGAIIAQQQPALVIIDSIQTMTTQELSGAPGSVGQVRESTDRLTDAAKRFNIPTFLVGHVTKEGNIAGPKTLEHIVDAVLELSGERTGQLRLLRAIKNRFGATDEVGVFKLDEVGLAEVTNPSEFFLEHADASVPGSATTCVMEGTRPLLMEVQALVNESQLAMPRRVGRGIDVSRIQVLSAVLQKHCRLPLGSHDIFLSAAGGYRVLEPGVDLGLAVALASSLNNKSLPKKTVFIGEIGLLGEIRAVSYLERRVKEAKRLGFPNVYSRATHQSVKQLLKDLDILTK